MRSIRLMEPRDLPRVWSAAKAQNRRDGTNYPVPPVFDLNPESPRYGRMMPNIVLALVTEVNGRVRQGHVWLRTVEEMTFGGGAAEMAFSGEHIPVALELLRRRGYDSNHVLVPKQRLQDLEEMLLEQGFTRIDHRLAHFFRTI